MAIVQHASRCYKVCHPSAVAVRSACILSVHLYYLCFTFDTLKSRAKCEPRVLLNLLNYPVFTCWCNIDCSKSFKTTSLLLLCYFYSPVEILCSHTHCQTCNVSLFRKQSIAIFPLISHTLWRRHTSPNAAVKGLRPYNTLFVYIEPNKVEVMPPLHVISDGSSVIRRMICHITASVFGMTLSAAPSVSFTQIFILWCDYICCLLSGGRFRLPILSLYYATERWGIIMTQNTCLQQAVREGRLTLSKKLQRWSHHCAKGRHLCFPLACASVLMGLCIFQCAR